MTPERWARVQEVFAAALEVAPNARRSFLDDASADDQELRREVDSLLRSHDEASNAFLESPAVSDDGPLPRSLDGRQLGPYVIVARLGSGGMGEVYRARDRKLDRDVAIKVLPAHMSSSPEALARFEREAKAVAALSHQNILAIHDFGRQDGITYAVTELLDGETLRSKLDGGALTAKDAVDYARQIARGLAAAHERGIVHRDLKPENLFVARDGHIKILDFGLAKRDEPVPAGKETSAPTASGHTEPGTVMGTVGYMSPEQVRGLPVDHRTDIFSFGVVLYEMLSGRKPFRRETAADTMSAILNQDPPELSGKTTPAGLDRVVRHCLEKDRERRFQSARDIVFALTDPSSAAALSFGSTPASSIPKRRILLYALAAAVVVLVAIAAVVLSRRSAAPVADAVTSIAVLPFTNLSSDKDQEFFSDGLAEELMGLLAKVKGLRVAGRTSSFAFKGKGEDLAAIGQKLHVSVVLEGSVRRTGDQLRVRTELVNVADGFQIWAETYDRKTSDVFAVQDEIAAAVVAALKLKLRPFDAPIVSQHRTGNSAAYDSYLIGRQFLAKSSPEGYRSAIVAFEKAIQLDPGYSAAYAGLARTLNQMVDFPSTPADQVESQRRGLWAAEKSVELDPELAEAYSARGNGRGYVAWDWANAEADLRKAISLDPNDPLTHAHLARLLARVGRLREGIAEARKAVELEPLYVGGKNILGALLNGAGQHAEARTVLSRALELSPQNDYARFFLATTFLVEKNPTAALEGLEPPKSVYRKAMMALALHDLGREAEAQRVLDDLIAQHGMMSAWHIGIVYAWRGDADQAFEWLERAYAQRAPQLPTIRFDPLAAKLRGDPRYLAMLRKMNLPDLK